MIPVYQTKISDPQRGTLGNSFTACVASLMHMAPEDLPHFSAPDPEAAVQRIIDFLMARGYVLCHEDKAPPGWSIASVVVKGGALHNVVAFDGKVFHDPDPRREARDFQDLRVDTWWRICTMGEIAGEPAKPGKGPS